MPHRKQDWPALMQRARREKPQLLTAREIGLLPPQAKTAYLEDLRAYNRGLGPIATREARKVGEKIRAVVSANQGASLGGRYWVGIDGPAHIGKTQAAVGVALTATAAAWEMSGLRDGDAELWPFGYCEVSGLSKAAEVVRSMCDFYGFPYDRGDTAETLIKRLRAMLPQSGTLVHIIDDAHHLRVADPRANQLTNYLKHIVSGLPVTIVAVGADLRDSAWLKVPPRGDMVAIDQLRKRVCMVSMNPYSMKSAEDRMELGKLLASMEQLLAISPADQRKSLNNREVRDLLIDGSGGRIGTILDWLKYAAVQAVDHVEVLSADWLREHRPTTDLDEGADLVAATGARR